MAQKTWYYEKDGKQCGPVPREQLDKLLASGDLGGGNLVWSDGMAKWTAAAEVPGLLPAKRTTATPAKAAATAKPAAQAEPATAAAPAAGPLAALTNIWSELPNAAKIGIAAGGGVAFILLVVIVFVLVFLLMGGSKGGDQPKPPTQASRKPAAKPAPAPPVLHVYEFDPKSLTDPEAKAAYEKGVKQAANILRLWIKEDNGGKMPSKDQVKGLLTDRDKAIQASVNRWGLKDPETITTFGRRDGMKAELARQNLMP
ncbi:MAG: DUF4339 domain-containing protein [Thermoguttaceae bacterium]|jgi:hypothetical protein